MLHLIDPPFHGIDIRVTIDEEGLAELFPCDGGLLAPLRLLTHDNIMSVKTILKPKSLEEFTELYVVSELMETDLAQIIKSNQVLSDEHIQFFLY